MPCYDRYTFLFSDFYIEYAVTDSTSGFGVYPDEPKFEDIVSYLRKPRVKVVPFYPARLGVTSFDSDLFSFVQLFKMLLSLDIRVSKF